MRPTLKLALDGYYRVTGAPLVCDWPSATDASRKIVILPDDILSYDKGYEGMTKHCGVLYRGIVVPESRLCWVEGIAEAEYVL